MVCQTGGGMRVAGRQPLWTSEPVALIAAIEI